ncbi:MULTISPECIES: glutamate racemase [Sphingobacterium]|jgi:glutamate racemase|uniref:Glutamate racemase n=1 Tax=Sphingobacterium kitahiroshimense TaxID=470446 RepID=A0ABV0BMT3_9SPHI|nr:MULTISPECIES: glutamate racemase [Sphingobacterium]MBB2952325.1 glutamate racemase [Sphingobacterium sp. JUb56]MCS3553661.1 glutamate racemase [Sphingobacterium sp. JUb21]MCW2260785.1 glutamate racemase [Sphingobacterium kitahiroshimense]NJI75690.1 glutamate racemase [Sphingobacterium sp. B16(2022)]QQD13349.1 glutamate racemase [Sphingobacterium sp. UDSM-2020]
MEQEKKQIGPIGIFDSGYGGLSVFKEIKKQLPQYDYIYLGDNARIPYGTRSFETVYEFTKQCVFKLFDLGCNLVILACNTASAKALRSIQQNDLPPGKKVLGVIRPTTEIVKEFTKTNQVGILATTGTVKSESYKIEINKFYPEIKVFQHDCPFWVPLVENNEINTEGAKYFVEKDIEKLLKQSPDIDTIILACTHYPLLLPVIKQFVPSHINIISQGPLVAKSLEKYLDLHHDIEYKSSKNGSMQFYTTDDPLDFESKAEIFFGQKIKATHIKVT